jgi:hypothetical protein
MLGPADGVSVYQHWQPDTPVTVIAARSLAAPIEEVRCVWSGEPDGRFGRHVRLVGPNEVIVMSFPWWDHADRELAARRPDGWAPLAVTAGEQYDDLEQGWYQSTVEHDGWVYVFEADSDALSRLQAPTFATATDEPGRITVATIDASWFRVPVDAFRAAWRDAQAEARRMTTKWW